MTSESEENHLLDTTEEVAVLEDIKYGAVSEEKVSVPVIVTGNDPNDPYGAAYLFKYIMLAQIFVYMEAGVVPALLEQFTITFHLTPQLQGLLGAIVYIALSIASPFCAHLFRTYSPRSILGWSLLVNNVALFLFTFTPVGYMYSTSFFILSRGLIGFTQAFLSVYAPLWVHEYAPKRKRAGWMSFLQASIPVGITLGYLVGSVAVWCSQKPSGCYFMLCWRWSLLFPSILMTPFALLTFWIPEKHITTRHLLRRKSLVLIDVEEDDEDLDPIHNSETAVGSHSEGLKLLLHTPVFVYNVLGLSALFFVVTGVQYWGTLYLSTNTSDSAYVVHLAYLFVAGTGPIVGVFFGGWLIDQYGGYSDDNQAKALEICVIQGIVGALAAIPPSFLHDTYSIAFFLWIMLFCGGSILPACTGIVISSVPRQLRPLASSVASTSYNLLGFAASNYLPGVIMNLVNLDENCDPSCLYRIGFRVVLFWSTWSLLFITLAWWFAKHR